MKLPKFIASTLGKSALAKLPAGGEIATITSTPLIGRKVVHRIPQGCVCQEKSGEGTAHPGNQEHHEKRSILLFGFF